MVRALSLAEGEGTHQVRSQTANALKSRRYTKSAPTAGKLSPVMDLMKSSHNRTARASLLLLRARQ